MSDGSAASEEFRAYLAPLAVEPGSARIAQRWTGIANWAKNARASQLPALVSMMRNTADDADRSQLEPFFAAQVQEDETFNTINSGELIRALSAAALDYIFTRTSDLDTAAALAVVTSSWGGRAPSGIAVDILRRATAELDHIAGLARDRQDLNKAVMSLSLTPLPPTTDSIRSIREGAFDHMSVAVALEEVLTAANAAIGSQTQALRELLSTFVERIEQCDEETDVLWYIFGGVSGDANSSFSALEPSRAAFYAAREIGQITSRPMRVNAAVELFKRCGAKGRKLTFVEAVEAMPSAWIAQHATGDFSPSLFPIHRALARYAAIAEERTWVSGWSQATGIAADLKVDPTDLAVAFYRERLLRKEIA
ncbi:GTPase-associated system all-helical protein GASH [Sphingomonas sp.]|uniref:GTPase-associated system all-helical protein GASH n=1 Tax=Sphingomonas sp. TaxID=28214 RepID=UPI0028B18EBE|nr:GTPase-associated system all-helical protein GASH [Sphingomonas sp.]